MHASNNGVMDAHLVAQLAGASPDAVLRVFVHASDATRARRSALHAGLDVVDTFDKVGVAVAAGAASAIARLSSDPTVSYLEADRPIVLTLDTANVATRGNDARAGFTGTDDSVSSGVDGSGVTIAVVDSGIDGTHPMFQVAGESKVVRNLKLLCREQTPAYFPNLAGQGQVPPSTCPANSAAREQFWADMTELGNDTDSTSAGGHGTHVAGIAAGVDVTSSDGREMHGAAPGAKLVGLSVGESASVYGGAAGLNWVLDHHANPCGTSPTPACPAIRIVSNSWGILGGGEFDPNGAITKIEDVLVAEGVLVVFANGNDGGDGTDNVSSPYAQNPTPGVIGVANYDDQGTGSRNGTLDSSSSRGDKTRPATWPDVSAPGHNITSACRAYLTVCGTGLDVADPDYNTISGTSMATPMVSGIAAQLIQAGATSPAQIEDLISTTAHKFTFGAGYTNTDAYGTESFDKGHGLIDAKAAVAKVRDIPIEPTPPPPPGGGGHVCVPADPVVVDPEGDAIGPVSSGSTGAPNETALDIREGRLSWDDSAKALTFSVSVTDLAATNPDTAPNISFNYTFNYAGAAYEVEAARNSDGSTQFVFGEVIDGVATTARRHLRAVGGAFDAAGDKITIVVTNADLTALGIDPFEANDQLDTFAIVSRRAVATSVTTAGGAADSASAQCPYTIGLGSVPTPNQGTTPDAEIDGTNTTHTWTGDVVLSAVAPFTGTNTDLCDGTATNESCPRRRIKVTVPEGGAQLLFRVYSGGDSFIMNVYKPDGATLFGTYSDPLSDTATVEGLATESGVYTVVLRAWYAVNAHYSGLARLGDAPTPAADGSAAAGQDYAWDGSVPDRIDEAFDPCPSEPYTGCDVRHVAVTVTGTGATLNVSITADDLLTDLDLYVYGPDGEEVGVSAGFLVDESISEAITVSGVYTIVVKPYVSSDATYSGLVHIS